VRHLRQLPRPRSRNRPPPVLQARREEAFEVPTALGPAITTAPETLPSRNTAFFAKGDAVSHLRFGPRQNPDVAGENLMVRFDQGVKKVRSPTSVPHRRFWRHPTDLPFKIRAHTFLSGAAPGPLHTPYAATKLTATAGNTPTPGAHKRNNIPDTAAEAQ
jgi:hypothetical protein